MAPKIEFKGTLVSHKDLQSCKNNSIADKKKSGFTGASMSENCSVVSSNPMDYTVHGILQARILEWVTFPFSRGSSQPTDQTRSPALQADSLPTEPSGKPKNTRVGSLSLLCGIFLTHESNGGLLQVGSLPAELPGTVVLAEVIK